jgi:hypothetical protein
MGHLSTFGQPSISRLPNVLLLLVRGEIRIPRFQRTFVWSDPQRLRLFNSVYQGMPVGSLLIWQTKEHEIASFARLRGVQDPPNVFGYKQYLLDGLQRLTTLSFDLAHGLLLAEQTEEDVEDEIPPIDYLEIDQDRRHIYFDLESREFVLETQRQEAPVTWVPLSRIFSEYDLRPLRDKLGGLPNGRILLNRMEDLVSRFKDYELSILPIVSEDINLVTESFRRVNSAGTKMDEVNMVNAMMWTPNFDLIQEIAQIKSDLAEIGWDSTDDRDFLSIIKIGLDLDFYGTNIGTLRDALVEDSDLLINAGQKLWKAAAFLGEHCGIWSPATVPYKHQAILLADALSRIIDGPEEPLSESLVEALKRWFWLTTYGEYFAATTYSRLREAVTHVRNVVKQGANPKPDDLVPTVRPWPRFSLKNARSRAILLRLAELDPLNSDGESQNSERLLAENGATAAPKLLSAKEAGDHEGFSGVENRVIVHSKQLTSLRRALLSSDCDVKILRSHGIEEGASRALHTGDYRHFLVLRRAHLMEIERQFVKNLGLESTKKIS